MSSWEQFAAEAPELAEKVRARFEANTHHVMATLKADGSPRVSGTEVRFWRDDVWLGSMWQARKALDLQRDPRVAVHANPSDPEMAGGDAKLDAVAEEVTGEVNEAFFGEEEAPPGPNHLFRLDLRLVSLVEVDQVAEILAISTWRPGEGVRRIERR